MTKSLLHGTVITRSEIDLIADIVHRAIRLTANIRRNRKTIELMLDLCVLRANGTKLDLKALSEADDVNFAHDIFGIERHLDRETGKLLDGFRPRFLVDQE